MKRFLVAICLAAGFAATARAQSGLGGIVLNHDSEWATDFAQLSRTHTFGTARSMGMGGAFTSLGADLTSMTLNPAGLGMYRRNEISLTPMISVASSDTEGLPSWQGNGKTRFSMANIGMAINIFESPKSKLTSLTLGFGLNRVADFNTRYSFSSESRYDPSAPRHLMPTIADVFCKQMNVAGIFPDSEGRLGYMNPYIWPATLAYNGYVIDAENGEWISSNRIGSNASVLHSADVQTRGSINEFDLSLGANLNNILYVGATIGLQSVHKRLDVTCQEEYGYFNTDGYAMDSEGRMLREQLDYMNLWQRTVLDGSGVNFKLGVIVRPVAGLRLGVAFHSPTFYSLERSYRADIGTRILSNTSDQVSTPGDAVPEPSYDEGPNSWNFASPSRLLFGASYTFGKMAVVSVDYQRDWYNGIRMKNLPQGLYFSARDYKMEFKNNFRATNTVRAGIELKPHPVLALRAGGGYTDSMLRDDGFYTDDIYSSMPVSVSSYYLSAGLGFALSRVVSLDLAYQYMSEELSRYQLFFYREGPDFGVESGAYKTVQSRHFAALSLNFRF